MRTRPTKPHGDTKFGTKAGMRHSWMQSPEGIYARQEVSVGRLDPHVRGSLQVHHTSAGSQAHRRSPQRTKWAWEALRKPVRHEGNVPSLLGLRELGQTCWDAGWGCRAWASAEMNNHSQDVQSLTAAPQSPPCGADTRHGQPKGVLSSDCVISCGSLPGVAVSSRPLER